MSSFNNPNFNVENNVTNNMTYLDWTDKKTPMELEHNEEVKREIELDISPEEKEFFSKVDIKYKDEIELYRTLSLSETYKIYRTSFIHIKPETAKAAIYAILNSLMLCNFDLRTISSIYKHKLLYEPVLDKMNIVMSEIVHNNMVNYIDFVLFTMELNSARSYLLDFLFHSKKLETFPDIIKKLTINDDMCKNCFSLSIKYNSPLIGKFRKDRYIENEEVLTAIEYSEDEKLVKELIGYKLASTDEPNDLVLYLSKSLITNKPIIRDFLIKKSEELSTILVYDWFDVFNDMIQNLEFYDEYNDKAFIHIDMFNYTFSKVKKYNIEYGTTSETYNLLWTFREIFLSYPLHISKPFIDQYKLEQFQQYYDIFRIDANIGNMLNQTDNLNKESFLYYLINSPQKVIPSYFLTSNAIIYLINSGFNKENLKNVKLAGPNALDFITSYQETVDISLDCVANIFPSELVQLTKKYI